jgi:hypothetical protein
LSSRSEVRAEPQAGGQAPVVVDHQRHAPLGTRGLQGAGVRASARRVGFLAAQLQERDAASGQQRLDPGAQAPAVGVLRRQQVQAAGRHREGGHVSAARGMRQ